ncbi:hypothetical protein NMY22_g4158 [Coprinellus aureogranulatus]|nr:hypothetical protein NMY22_g4158 [Coprinellus aureogranulatus]
MQMKFSLLLALVTTAIAIPTRLDLGFDAQNVTGRAPSASKKVIAQMFGWNWDSLAAECRNFLGPEGYGYIQVSPPSEHITGPEWWTDYQVVSYNLNSKRGNRDQFRNMVNACHNAGVGVIVDTIWNHMAGAESGTGVGGSSFTHYVYPGTYQSQDFHHCGTPNDDIQDYTNRQQVQTCELYNLADLATETEWVRSRLAQYGNDLLSLGVDGFRLDAAKRKWLLIPLAGTGIDDGLSKRPYITQEVTYSAGDAVQPSEYTGNGDVQEFRYTAAIKDAFLNGDISGLRDLGNRGWIASDRANVFVTNHDNERNGGSLTVNSPKNAYVLGYIFSLAHPYGTPTVLSGFSFSNYDQGAPNNGAGTCSANGSGGGWNCEHRWPAVSGMVRFRNAAGSNALANWYSPARERIAFGRGNAAFVAINNRDDAWNDTFQTSLPAGTYCEAISGKPSGSGCTGGTVTVDSSGRFTASVYPRSAVAIYRQ